MKKGEIVFVKCYFIYRDKFLVFMFLEKKESENPEEKLQQQSC